MLHQTQGAPQHKPKNLLAICCSVGERARVSVGHAGVQTCDLHPFCRTPVDLGLDLSIGGRENAVCSRNMPPANTLSGPSRTLGLQMLLAAPIVQQPRCASTGTPPDMFLRLVLRGRDGKIAHSTRTVTKCRPECIPEATEGGREQHPQKGAHEVGYYLVGYAKPDRHWHFSGKFASFALMCGSKDTRPPISRMGNSKKDVLEDI